MTAPGEVVRRGASGDVPRLVVIDSHSPGGGWSAAQFEGELRLAWSRVLVVESGGALAGFVVYWAVAGEVQIQNLAVAEEHRRRGVARCLLRHVLDEAMDGDAPVYLEVRRGNAAALALYRAVGFREIGTRPGYYRDGEDALVLEWRSGAGPRPLYC